MKQFFRLLALLLILGSTTCRAENDTIVHNFTSLVSKSQIVFSKNAANVANGVGTVNDGIVYTCKGTTNAKFFSPSLGEFALNLGATGDSVTTTRIDNLKEIKMINVSSAGLLTTNIKLQLSTDGSTWGETLEFTKDMKTCGVKFSKGNYYVKLYNNSSPSSSIYITELRFVTEPEDCNCFVYTP